MSVDLGSFTKELREESLAINRWFLKSILSLREQLLSRILARTPIRTGYLWAHWRTDTTSDPFESEIINSADYAPFVRGKNGLFLSDQVDLSVREIDAMEME